MAYVYYSDLGSDDYDMQHLQMEHHVPVDWSNQFWVCMVPSTQQIAYPVGVMLFACFLCRFGWIFARYVFRKSDIPAHLVSSLTGFGMLVALHYDDLFYNLMPLIGLAVAGYIAIYTLDRIRWESKYIGFMLTLSCILTTISFEFILLSPLVMQRIRSHIMVLSMKIISIAFDLDVISSRVMPGIRRSPKISAYIGYLLCPSTVVLGPWLSFPLYVRSTRPSQWMPWRFHFILWCPLSFAVAAFCLTFSNCIVSMIDVHNVLLLRAYRDALSVRMDHYFSCFLAQALVATNGIMMHKTESPNKLLGFMLSRPLRVEFPRSLADIVRNWNIPMHDFLRKYIYGNVYSHCANYLTAIVITYFVSAVLHGIHLQVYLVLLSLSIFSYVEYVLRAKLARTFDFCITANACKRPCRFAHCPSHGLSSDGAWMVMFINFVFSLMDMGFLAYLGIMMTRGAVSPNGTQILSPTEGLTRWHELTYAGHWGMLILFVFYLSI